MHSAASGDGGGGVKSMSSKEYENPEVRDIASQCFLQNHQRQPSAMWGTQSASDPLIAEDGIDSENSSVDGHANDFNDVVSKRATKRRRRRTKQDGISCARHSTN